MSNTSNTNSLSSIFNDNVVTCFEPVTNYEIGEIVYKEGSRPKGLFFINSGCVKVITGGAESEEPLIRIAGPNQFVGFVPLLKQLHYSNSAIAFEKTEIQFISKESFFNLLESDIPFCKAVIELLCVKQMQTDNKIIELITKDGRQRLATLLLSLDAANDHYGGNGVIHLPKKDIAATIALTPPTLSRYLGEFKNEGFISMPDHTIELLDRESLMRICQVRD